MSKKVSKAAGKTSSPGARANKVPTPTKQSLEGKSALSRGKTAAKMTEEQSGATPASAPTPDAASLAAPELGATSPGGSGEHSE